MLGNHPVYIWYVIDVSVLSKIEYVVGRPHLYVIMTLYLNIPQNYKSGKLTIHWDVYIGIYVLHNIIHCKVVFVYA